MVPGAAWADKTANAQFGSPVMAIQVFQAAIRALDAGPLVPVTAITEVHMSNKSSRFQGSLALATSLLLLGVLAAGVIIALVRLIQYVWRFVG